MKKSIRKPWLDKPLPPIKHGDVAMWKVEIGCMIYDLRIANGLTQVQLARKLGTKQPAIARLEGGSYLPSLAFLCRLCGVLKARMIIKFLV